MTTIKYLQRKGKLRTIHCGSKAVDNALHLLALLNYKVLSIR